MFGLGVSALGALTVAEGYEWLVLIGLGCAAVARYHGVLQCLETLGYWEIR